jgi:uncharacterized protein
MALVAGSYSNRIKSRAYIKRLNGEVLFVTISILGLLSTQATAASFDCKKAASWVEKTVCANPELSKLDEQMAKAYTDALKSLSPEGQQETKQYQKQWLKNLSSYCEAELKAEWVRDKEKCLKKAYKKRTKQLQESLIKFPDRIFRNVYFDASEIDSDCVDNPCVDVEFSYPQIENQRSENEKFWNNLVYQKAKKFITDDEKRKGNCADSIGSYIMEFSNVHLISCQYDYYQYDHGTPHGYGSTRFLNWLLDAKRELTASDLFDDKTDWRNKLVSLVTQKKKEQEAAKKRQNEYSEYTIPGEDFKTGLIDADRLSASNNWMVSKEGLVFRIDAWNGSHSVLFIIDWKTLDPYLSKNGRSLIHE